MMNVSNYSLINTQRRRGGKEGKKKKRRVFFLSICMLMRFELLMNEANLLITLVSIKNKSELC